ncbi:unnamed protein product, partial [Rotaria socialis]
PTDTATTTPPASDRSMFGFGKGWSYFPVKKKR